MSGWNAAQADWRRTAISESWRGLNESQTNLIAQQKIDTHYHSFRVRHGSFVQEATSNRLQRVDLTTAIVLKSHVCQSGATGHDSLA